MLPTAKNQPTASLAPASLSITNTAGVVALRLACPTDA
jgi:hypothetical protein